MNAEIWRHLGIPPTESEVEVRRAYAERLKITHPEDDPEGFKRLRNAYERAMEEIRWRTQYAQPDGVEENWDDENYDEAEERDYAPPRLADLARAGSVAPAPQPDTPPEPDPELDAHEALSQALQQAVAKGSPWEVQSAFKSLIANPAMERLNIYAATETWIANLIRHHSGGGQLFEYAQAHFKWDNRSGRHLGASMIAYRESLAEETKAKAFLARVKDRRHEFHAAFKQLQRPPKERGWLSRLASFPRIHLVRRFLDYVEDKARYARDEINYQAEDWWRRRINFWLTPLSVISRLLPIGIVIGVIALAMIFDPLDVDGDRSSAISRAAARAACVLSVEDWTGDNVGACDAYLQQAPDSLLMRQYAGMVALRQERYADARAHFETILGASPLDPAAHYGLGLALRASTDPAEQVRAVALMRDAFAIDDTVSVRFAQYGFASVATLDPADTIPTFPAPGGPRYDVAPGQISLENDQRAFGDAYEHFGIRESFPDGRVLLQCLSRTTGRFTDCQIVEETPLNGGRGEVAIRVMASAIATPAILDGELVDAVPIRVPFSFRLAE